MHPYQNIHGFMLPTRLDYRWFDADGAMVSHFASHISDLRLLRGDVD